MRRFVFALAIPLIAGGCASLQPSMVSYVGVTDLHDVSYVASAITTYVATKLPPSSSTVLLEQPPGGWDPVTPELRDELRSRGFTMADAAHPAGAHTLSYIATPFEGGMLVEISIDGAQASQFLARDSAGKLEAGGPYTVREASL